MVTWYTLSYTYKNGEKQRLYNLQRAGADDVERAQRALGSRGFVREKQPHHYHQLELDLLKGAKHV